MTDNTGVCKGGPMDGKTVTGSDVMHFRFTPYESEKSVTHRYQFDRGTYRHQGRRNIDKHGINNDVTVRVCNECFIIREDYISTKCPACGSGWYSRG